jgi:hypothetical protein
VPIAIIDRVSAMHTRKTVVYVAMSPGLLVRQ